MTNKIYGSVIQDALHWKYKGIPLVIYEDYESIIWPEGFSIPSIEDVDLIINEYNNYITLVEYKDKRKAEYPKIEDQLDMIWHSMDNEEITKDSIFYPSIKIVKDKYPKTER